MPEFSLEFWVGAALAIIALLIGLAVAIGMDAKTKGEFTTVVCCFIISASIVCYGIVEVDMTTKWSTFPRVLVVYALLALTIVLTGESIRWARIRHNRAAIAKPEPAETAKAPAESVPKTEPSPPTATSTTTRPERLYEPPIERTSKFTVMIPFDTAPNSAPIPTDENMADPMWDLYSDLQTLAQQGAMPDSARDTTDQGQITWTSTPVSMQQAPDFLARVLQYYIFHCLDSLQHDSMKLTLGAPAETRAGIEPPDAERYSYEKLSKELSDSPFFRPFRHRPSGDDMAWKAKASKFPKKMEIKFLADTPDKYLVSFQRPHYFKADFIVQQFLGTGVGQMPKNFASKMPARSCSGHL
jgi:hypothetical protein